MHLLVSAVSQFDLTPVTMFEMCLHEWLFEVREFNIFCGIFFPFIFFLLFLGAKDVLFYFKL